MPRRRAPKLAVSAALAALLLGPAAPVPAVGAHAAAVEPRVSGAAAVEPSGSGAAAASAPSAAWEWPVAPPIRVVAPYRQPATPYAAGHRGIDVAASAGDPVVAAEAGVVSFAGQVAGREVVAIDHGGDVVSAVEPVLAVVAEGETVARGAPIGVVGAGGHCDGACVHFGVRVDGEYVSPFVFLGGVPRAVLLPLAD
ncbi:M23 family metallopeptidase [Agromyces sp. G08B096]|uniref:M23 family metallopeptidase n=1 Tax=Agromyces sp. G08B096 TaxID=3156399 RepID=A0AAU7WB12_9MICO